MKKYESFITKDFVEIIVRELIRNGNCISKEAVNSAIFYDDMYLGIDKDVTLYKGIDSETTKKTAMFGNEVVDDRDIQDQNMSQEIHLLCNSYAREMIFLDTSKPKKDRCLQKQNAFKIFREKLIHKSFSKEDFEKGYKEILEKYSGCTNDETLNASAKYKSNYIFSDKLKHRILENIKNGTAIELLDKTNNTFTDTLNQITAELEETVQDMPNLNEILTDIEQIYNDVECQLKAYSTDLSGLGVEEIENAIKKINSLSLSYDKKCYIGNNGYRTKNVGVSNKDIGVKYLQVEHVEDAMKNLAGEISTLVNEPDCISEESYIKKACELTYRFIRIHPFPDSNGRTSRALMNMLTLNRNILVPFPKETKDQYINAMNKTSKKVGYRDDNGYLESLYSDPQKARELEGEYTTDIYEYIKNNAVYGINYSCKSNIKETDEKKQTFEEQSVKE